ncbi:MAG TPA: sn-glycerol-3-phosphate ABC transporter ATP-binding protein UgpC [Candidatus Kapabacteria bacterium]|nr:sn-glycerol-3-phosphate ABC transporter ATP-binding protein UgpC [Candidatus Kapabacteria bacterium]
MTKITLKNVTKTYQNNKLAVSNLSFEANEGEFVVLVGPSGCGKTTVLRMIAGLEDISEGEIYFDSMKINEVEPKLRDVGMVFQNYALYPHLTVFQNIAFPLSIRKEKKDNIKKRVQEIAEILQITELLNLKPKQISGGQRQRVALGRAIIRKPKCFLFDEPLSNLDAKLRVQMRTEITNLQKELGITAIYVTHDQVEAMTMADKIVLLNDGIASQIGSPAELYNKPNNVFVATFIGTPQINLFDGKIELDKKYFFIDKNKNKFPLPESSVKRFDNPNNISILAIRPENIKPVDDNYNSEYTFTAKVKNKEYIGHETYIFFSNGDDLKSCRITYLPQEIEIGKQQRFEITEPGKMLLF